MTSPAFRDPIGAARAPAARSSTTASLASAGHRARGTRNAFSVDVEEHYQVEAFRGIIARDQWDRFESRVEVNTRRLLRLLEKRSITATFFMLGCVAERYPWLVRECVDAGHEIASHGWDHRPVTELTREEFRRDVRRTKNLLQQLGGVEVLGYRAPTYSIVKSTMWALEVLLEEGYRYDSSIFPIVHDRYGIPDAPRFPHRLKAPNGCELAEFPMSTVMLVGRRVPVAGGGYFRLMPYSLTRRALRGINRDGQPAMVYLHPWELDPDQPRLPVGPLTRFRHLVNVGKTEARLVRLLGDFAFGPAAEVLAGAGLLAIEELK
jgi:polysaccharide deacetylase family protein (PEP-CTERM system associated)